MAHTVVIAEMGSTHDGRLDRALELVEVAADAGADAVKAQYWSTADRMAERRRADAYREVYRRYAVPEAWLSVLRDHAHAMGLEFVLSCYLPEDVPIVARYADRIKVASFEVEDSVLHTALIPYRRTHAIIVSTGMMNAAARGYQGMTVLHCVSAYPAPVEEMNLSVIKRLSMDGLSDHTLHPWTGALAVAAGATILERHLRLDTTDPTNPDYLVSSSPALFAEYVRHVRLAETMLGDGVKRAMPSEAAMIPYKIR